MKKLGFHNQKRIWPILLVSMLLIPLFLFSPVLVSAQSGSNTISLSIPTIDQFPKISLYFWPLDQEGKFVNKLTSADVHVLENDREIKIDSLELQQPGTHFVIAINEAKTLGNSYSGKTRMARMQEVWTTWAQAQSIATVDDFSLVTNEGVVENQLSKPSEWVQVITDYQPDLKNSVASVTSLSQAINLLSSSSSTDQKSRAILYVTPLPTEDQFTALQDQASLAEQAKIRLFIWLIGPQNYTTEKGTLVLQQIAQGTGGSFFLFSGAETLPEISSYLEPFNFEYKVTYTTGIQSSGDYTLSIQIDSKDFQVTSKKTNFSIKVTPPNPIFLSPPSQITLDWVRSDNTEEWQITPGSYTLKYLVEFLDGHTRDLTSVRLFVDDKLTSEDQSAPFDELVWDLSTYTESGKHRLQIYVEDKIGLTAKTIEIPVEIVVNPKPLNALEKIVEKVGLQNLLVTLLLILVVVGLFFVLRRFLLKSPSRISQRRKRNTDPLLQNVVTDENEYPIKPAETEVTGWPRLPSGAKAPARLILLASGTSFLLPFSDTILGSDAKRCNIQLAGPTVAPVHAQIFTDAAKNFYISDKGSAAGTWVNYAPVSTHGTHLEHGDLVNIGSQRFKFEVVNPEGRVIQVLPYKEE